MTKKSFLFRLFCKRDRFAEGVAAATLLITTGDKTHILKNYGLSRGAPDQTPFDAGYQKTIRAWISDKATTPNAGEKG